MTQIQVFDLNFQQFELKKEPLNLKRQLFAENTGHLYLLKGAAPVFCLSVVVLSVCHVSLASMAAVRVRFRYKNYIYSKSGDPAECYRHKKLCKNAQLR